MNRSAAIRGSLRGRLPLHLIVVGLAALLISACGDGGGGEPISAKELLDRMNDGSAPLLLDVRSTGEFETIHIAGALNIPLYQLEERLSELSDPGDEIVLVDQKGGRSRMARMKLLDAGFTNTRILEGHMFQWVLNRYPVAN